MIWQILLGLLAVFIVWIVIVGINNEAEAMPKKKKVKNKPIY